MGAQGNTTIDFGASPGASDASVTVVGQAGIVAGSCVEAWIRAEASANHSSDEHVLETIKIVAKDIIAGTGFTIMAINTSQLNEPVTVTQGSTNPNQLPRTQGTQNQTGGGIGTRLYGVWNVSWVWN